MRGFSLLFVTLFPWSVAAQVQPADTLFQVERYLDYETVQSPRISPDGNAVVFGRRAVDKMKDSWETSLWIMNADGSNLRFLLKGADPVWSADGTRIAFLAPGEPGGIRSSSATWMPKGRCRR